MEEIFLYFLKNMAMIIALMYLALKVREYWFAALIPSKHAHWSNGLFIGFLSFSIMYNPLLFEGMRLDLREAPLFFVAFAGGWQTGVVALIIPTIYRALMGGPTMMIGIFQSIFLPVLIGALFHNKKAYAPPLTIIDIKRMMIGFAVFEAIKTLVMIQETPATFPILLAMAIFSAIAVLAIGLMLNDAHRHIIERKELVHQSTHDPLTDLPNIRSFHANVRGKLYQNKPMAIVMMDVDHFKRFNDTYGHPEGDVLLKTLSRLIRESVRPQDFIARYGGEEFIICFMQIESVNEAVELADRLRTRVEAQLFRSGAGQPDRNVTTSMGISFSTGNAPLDELIAQADQALYQSKANGRNCITVFRNVEAPVTVK